MAIIFGLQIYDFLPKIMKPLWKKGPYMHMRKTKILL